MNNMSEEIDGLKALVRETDATNATLNARVAVLETKLEACSQAWYFPSEDMTSRALARLVCMCGEHIRFVEPSTRELRAVNCKCGRRWIWRWTDQSGKGG